MFKAFTIINTKAVAETRENRNKILLQEAIKLIYLYLNNINIY